MASEPGGYRGLLVDYGGVLTTSLFDSFRSFCELEGLAPETVSERFRHDRRSRELLIGLETGRLPEEQFERQLGAALGVDGAQLIDRLLGAAQPDPPMLEAVQRARDAGIRTGLVSNSWGTRRYDRARLAELFHAVVLSGEVAVRKPAPEIYALGAERIGLPARRCVFVDDLPFNLAPAAELGMATVHHVSAQETISALERLLGLPLR
jgi:epoxide hydrolase-like predicted phosphatase